MPNDYPDEGVHSSEWKWEATPEGVGDIVYSTW